MWRKLTEKRGVLSKTLDGEEDAQEVASKGGSAREGSDIRKFF